MRHSSLFRSRWLALIWSAGIMWSAISFVAPDDAATDISADGAGVDDAANLNQLQALVGKLNR